MGYAIAFTVLLLIVLILKKLKTHPKQSSVKHAQHRSHKTTERLSFLGQKWNKTPVVSSSTRTRQKIIDPIAQTDLPHEHSVLELNHDFAQEAQLNIALKKDPTQYPLYLELLNLHLSHQNDLAAQRLLQQIEKISHPDLYQQALELQRVELLQRPPETTLPPSNSDEAPEDSKKTNLINDIASDIEVVLAEAHTPTTTIFAEYSPNAINELYGQGLDPDPNVIPPPSAAPISAAPGLALIEYFIDQAHAIKTTSKVQIPDQENQTDVVQQDTTPKDTMLETDPAYSLSHNMPEHHIQFAASVLAEIQAADASLAIEIQAQSALNAAVHQHSTSPEYMAVNTTPQPPDAALEFDFPEIDTTSEVLLDQVVIPEIISLFKIEFDPSEIESPIPAPENEAKK